MRRAILAGVLALMAGALTAREAPGALRAEGDPRDLNPLAGYRIELALPALELVLVGSLARVPEREATLLLDGRPAVILPIPGGEAALPPRRWIWRDYLVAGGVAGAVGVAAYVAGWVVGALQ